ncbi:uncharacterized protein AB675_6924 [Cyphellophora attinorum]|uniref:Pheromone alpha factor receptor n=1 Tax=Cyphellophora attinorum TaxID=1664694 RepID=A0A0N1HUW0_9EURO|nr:uncharacterized protein AB675_6924 [Phialophora attinorum]KPI43314.1 hypothetical protein AB675_6924 [Phialophora attinorum]
MADGCTFNAPVFPIATEVPINGFRGSLHQTVFFAPSYHRDDADNNPVSQPLTWSLVDNYGSRTASRSGVDGITLGMVLVSFLYVGFITPSSKRGTPFHKCLLSALFLDLIYRLLIVLQDSSLTFGRFPAYRSLTQDPISSYTTAYTIYTLTLAIFRLASTAATTITLLLQPKSILSVLRMTRRVLFISIIIYLCLASTATLIFQILFVVIQIHTINLSGDSTTPMNGLDRRLVSRGLYLASAIAICSFCAISLAYIVYALGNRRKVTAATPGDSSSYWMRWRLLSRYERALTTLSMVLLQSLIAPLILEVLSFVRIATVVDGVVETDLSVSVVNVVNVLVVPTVLVLLPFGGLFDGEGDDGRAPRRRIEETVGDAVDGGGRPCRDDGAGSDNNLGLLGGPRENIRSGIGFADRELEEIDRL